MLPTHLIEPLETLIRLDPANAYPERATKAMAMLVGATNASFEDCGTAMAANLPQAVVIPLREGALELGCITLQFASNKEAGSPVVMQTARAAARIFAQQLALRARITQAEASALRPEIEEAIARLPITRREREVVALLVAGASTRKIADKTNLTIATVHTYLKRIYPKVGVRSRVELVALVTGTQSLS